MSTVTRCDTMYVVCTILKYSDKVFNTWYNTMKEKMVLSSKIIKDFPWYNNTSSYVLILVILCYFMVIITYNFVKIGYIFL